jgi:hypothetical protein
MFISLHHQVLSKLYRVQLPQLFLLLVEAAAVAVMPAAVAVEALIYLLLGCLLHQDLMVSQLVLVEQEILVVEHHITHHHLVHILLIQMLLMQLERLVGIVFLIQ